MSIPQRIKELANKVRNEIYGKDVRESIAQSMEVTGGTAEDADIKSNEATDQVNSIQAQVDQLVIEGDSSVEAAQARVRADGTEFDTLRDRLNNGDEQMSEVAEQTNISKRALGYYWIPEQQPPAREDRDGYFIDGYRLQSDETIENYFEPMRLDNPDYITRTLLGQDQSGQFDIWRYHFTPQNYTKTIIINTCIHGGEVTTLIAMLRFLHYLVYEWEKYPALAEIRESVRIIYIPFANPWGVNHGVGERTRYNSRGVDLNRNFDYRWDEFEGDEPFGQNYKGEAPFSEVETQYIRDTLAEFSDAVAYFDLHNTGSPLFDYYVPVPENSAYRTYDKLIAYFTRDIDDPDVHYPRSINPSAPNYAYHSLGIVSSGPEWCDRRFGEVTFDSTEITKALEWFANIFIEHSRDFRVSAVIKEQYYRHTSAETQVVIDTQDFAELPEFNSLYSIPADGLVTYEGFVTVGLISGSGSCSILPMLGQSGNGTGYSYNNLLHSRWDNYVSLSNNDDRFSIPFYAAIPVRRTDGSSVVRLGYGLAGRAQNGVYRIYRYRGRITYQPNVINNVQVKEIVTG